MLLFATIISIKELLENSTCYHFLPEKGDTQVWDIGDNSKSLQRGRLLSCDITVPWTRVANSMGITPYAIPFPFWVSSYFSYFYVQMKTQTSFLLQNIFFNCLQLRTYQKNITQQNRKPMNQKSSKHIFRKHYVYAQYSVRCLLDVWGMHKK